MKWLAGLLLSINVAVGACVEVTVEGSVLCHSKEREMYLSKDCASVRDCFPFTGQMRIVPNQSPGFTMCYELKGEPFFAKIDGEKSKVPLCRKHGKLVDVNSLLRTYGPRAEESL